MSETKNKPAPTPAAEKAATAPAPTPDNGAEQRAMTTQPPTALSRYDFSQLGDTAIGAQDVQMPRLKLLQALSQPVIDQEAAPGNFWNSLTAENYGAAVKIIPVIGFKNRVYLEVGQGLMCRSLDMITGVGTPGGECAKCPLKDWPEDRKQGGPKCRESRNWVGLIVGAAGESQRKKGDGTPPEIKDMEPAFIVIQFTSMASGAARKLNGLFLNSRITAPTANWWDFIFTMNVNAAKNDKGAFFVPDIRPAGRTTDVQKEAAKSLLNFMSGRTLIVDVDVDDDTAGPVTPQPGQPSF